MQLKASLALIPLALHSCLGFKRTVPDISPLSTNYTKQGGIFNLTAAQITPGETLNSHYTAYFLRGSNGHDYFLIGQYSNNGPETFYRLSFLDINDGYYFGASYNDPNATVPADAFYFKSNNFETIPLTTDLVSSQLVKSTVKGAEFSLVSSPRGPNLYHAGNGRFLWGKNWTQEIAYPENWVTGNLTYKGELVQVVSEQSTSWYDRQYGPGVGLSGWDLFFLSFTNGIKAAIWHSEAVEDNPEQYFATILYPDGHHEIYPIDSDLSPSVPFVSNATGFTYYAKHRVNIPGLGATFNVEMVWPGTGEMTLASNPVAKTTLFEGYSVVTGTIHGKPVSGWGTTERHEVY